MQKIRDIDWTRVEGGAITCSRRPDVEINRLAAERSRLDPNQQIGTIGVSAFPGDALIREHGGHAPNWDQLELQWIEFRGVEELIPLRFDWRLIRHRMWRDGAKLDQPPRKIKENARFARLAKRRLTWRDTARHRPARCVVRDQSLRQSARSLTSPVIHRGRPASVDAGPTLLRSVVVTENLQHFLVGNDSVGPVARCVAIAKLLGEISSPQIQFTRR